MIFWSDIMEEAIYSAHIDEGQHKTVVIAEVNQKKYIYFFFFFLNLQFCWWGDFIGSGDPESDITCPCQRLRIFH